MSTTSSPTSADIKAYLKARAQKEVNEALAKGETPHPFAVIQARTGKLAVADDFETEDTEMKADKDTPKPDLSWMVVHMNMKLYKPIGQYHCRTIGNETLMGELGFEILDDHTIKLPSGWTTVAEMCPNGEHYFHFPITKDDPHATIHNRRAMIDRNGKMSYYQAPKKTNKRKPQKEKPEPSKRVKLEAKLTELQMTPVEFAGNLATAIDDDKPDLARLQACVMTGLVEYIEGLPEKDFEELTCVKVVP